MLILNKTYGKIVSGVGTGSGAYLPVPVVMGPGLDPVKAGQIKTIYWHINKRESMWLSTSISEQGGKATLEGVDVSPGMRMKGCKLLYDYYVEEGNPEGYELYMEWLRHQIKSPASGRSEFDEEYLPKGVLALRKENFTEKKFQFPEKPGKKHAKSQQA